MLHLRRSEWVLIAYFLYAAILSLALPVRPEVRVVAFLIAALIAAACLLHAAAATLPHRDFFAALRDWFPLPITLLCYREMGWFASPQHSHSLEKQWIVWDRLLLHQWGGRTMVEALGPVLPSILEIAYSLVYAIGPFALAMLYFYDRRDQADRFWVIFLFALLLSYAQFPFWPSEPPRTLYVDEDAPAVLTMFREFNLFLVGNHGIHTSVFPSAHVSGAFGAAFAMRFVMPERRWVWLALFVLAILIALATVYGRYHYAADAVAGTAVSVIALGVARLWLRAKA